MTSPETAFAAADVVKYHPGTANSQQQPSPIVSSATFVAGFRAPDYLVKGIVQRRFFYSLTARTGEGKTAAVLLLAANVALGQSFAGHAVTQGPVLYFAGENPDDVRMRWIAMGERLGFDVDTIPVHFVPGVHSIPEMMQQVRDRAGEIGGLALVIIDTTAAYFEGEDDNSNVQAGNHARSLRALTGVPDGPCVIACCHPTKSASNDNLVPRGGGAFLNEVDGNLTCAKDDAVLTLHWSGKFRGPGFDPISLELAPITSDRLMDADGDAIWTVMARPLSEAEQQSREQTARRDEDVLLWQMLATPGASFGKLAEALSWPNKSRVHRTMKRLHGERLVEKKRERWQLTKAGQKEAENVAL